MKQAALKCVLIAACLVGQSWSAALADEISLTLPVQADGNIKLALHHEGASREPSGVLRVFVGIADGCCDGKTPMAGVYHVDGKNIEFDPAFDFVIGQNYTVLTHDLTRRLTQFSIGAGSADTPPQVVAIYPGGAEIPENTLRFYIHFSEPMQPHMSAEFIKLVDVNGTADLAAFMTFKQELWNEDRTRLTLLMDPGRIKRGVATNLDLGPALLAGNSYSIVVEGGWPNARDGQEAAPFEHKFIVSPPMRVLPDTELWQFQRPKILSLEPLVIIFDRPFDHQLAQNAITVWDNEGHRVPGTVSVENHDRTWRFSPDSAWSTPKIRIAVDARFEDVAGNNFRELLDHSVETGVADIDQKTIDLDLRPSSH